MDIPDSRFANLFRFGTRCFTVVWFSALTVFRMGNQP